MTSSLAVVRLHRPLNVKSPLCILDLLWSPGYTHLSQSIAFFGTWDTVQTGPDCFPSPRWRTYRRDFLPQLMIPQMAPRPVENPTGSTPHFGQDKDQDPNDETLAAMNTHMDELMPYVVPDAIPSYSLDPACSLVEETTCDEDQVRALEYIQAWIVAPKPNLSPQAQPLLWISGGDNTRTTRVLREQAQRAYSEGRLLGSYFFSNSLEFSPSSATSQNETHFVATLAFQMASNVPGLEVFVARAIDNNPGVFSKPMYEQMESLIFGPLAECRRHYSGGRFWWRRLKAAVQGHSVSADERRRYFTFNRRYKEWWNRNIVVVDGLEQCGPDTLSLDNQATASQKVRGLPSPQQERQKRIIGLMEWAAMHPIFPLRFVFASQRASEFEESIRKVFQSTRICGYLSLEPGGNGA